jgi:hypothetical protein
MRIGHRLMIGDAVEAGGTFADTNNSWLGGSAANLRWVERDAQFETLSGVGLTAVLGGSRSSDTSNVSSWYGTSTASIGIVGIGYNDETGSARHVWGGYFEGKRGDVAGGSTGQGVTYGVEIDAINNGSAFVDRNPYSVSSADGVTIGLIVSSGGDVTINPNAMDATWGISFGNNPAAFGTGIAFVPGSLRARSDTYGKKRAMSLPATACIDWWQNDDTRFAAITGTYTAGDATHSATQSFASAAVNFYDQSDVLYATIGMSSTFNYLKNSLGIGTTSPDRNLHSEVDDATNNGVTRVLRLSHTTSGTPTAQIGVGMDFETESLGGNKVGAEILMRFTDVTSGQEDARIIFNVMRNGATAAQVLYLTAADTPVNYVAISGEPTGVGPVITADGETDVDLNLISKGAGNLVLNPSTGDIKWGKALVALGGGATATLGTIGGSGPGTAGQNTWMRLKDSTGAAFWVPAWK